MKQLIVLLSCCLFVTNLAAEPRKNVLFICVDDLNDWVGCMNGHSQSKTPFLDELAARGTLFKNAHCQAPICGPSRASFLSGRYPHETGLYDQPRGKGKMIDDAENFRGQLLPEYFSQNGYETLAAGKITHGYPLQKAVNQAGPTGNSGPKPEGPKSPDDVRFNFRPDYSQPYTGTQTDWAAFPDRDALYRSSDFCANVIRSQHPTISAVIVDFAIHPARPCDGAQTKNPAAKKLAHPCKVGHSARHRTRSICDRLHACLGGQQSHRQRAAWA